MPKVQTRITCTNGKARYSARIRLYSFPAGEAFNWRTAKLEDEFHAPSLYYCKKHPTGRYGKRFLEMLDLQSKLHGESLGLHRVVSASQQAQIDAFLCVSTDYAAGHYQYTDHISTTSEEESNA